MRLVGLPIHCWEFKVLKTIGDACGGLLDIDKQTRALEDLQWAHILVRTNCRFWK